MLAMNGIRRTVFLAVNKYALVIFKVQCALNLIYTQNNSCSSCVQYCEKQDGRS